MSDPTILGIIRRMAGGDEHDLSGTILEALQELEASLGGGGSYDIGTWTGATFENGWTGSVQYTKDSNGWVHIRKVANDADATAATVFTLPVGMRPGAALLFVGARGVSGGGTYVITVATTGAVSVSSALGAELDYSFNVSFYVG